MPNFHRLLFRAALLALLAPAAAAADESLLKLSEQIRRVEERRDATRSADERRALIAPSLPRYREYAAALAIAKRGADAFDAVELVKARTLLDLSAARYALDAGALPPAKAAALETLRTPSVEELRALLPPGTVYLSYVLQNNVFLVVALSGEHGGLIHRPPLPPNLSASIAAFRFLLAIPAEWRERIAGLPKVWRRTDGAYQVAAKPPQSGAAEVREVAEIAAYLGERLLAPAARHLAGAGSVIVCPDADLAFLPFEALRLDNRYLAESHQVQYTAAAGLYALSRARATQYESLQGRAGLLALGGALYEPLVQVTPMLSVHPDLLYGLPRQLRAIERTPTTVPAAFRALKINWANLPGTEEEAKRIAALFDKSRVLAGIDASEQRLAELNHSGELARYRHVFFATHGYLSPYDPRLSAVVLSQVGTAGPHDGYITAAEWPRYDLRSDLVLISAANSGFGPAASAEGLLGLPFALHLAGNRNTVLSLWTLNDPVTAAFVEQFFSRVRAGAGHAAALAETKRDFIAAGRPASYWAPFVLHGS